MPATNTAAVIRFTSTVRLHICPVHELSRCEGAKIGAAEVLRVVFFVVSDFARCASLDAYLQAT